MMMWSRRAALLGTILVGCVSCDQATKSVATTGLAGQPPISLVGDTIRLSYVENAGGFLSIGAGLPAGIRVWLFGAFTLAALVALVAIALRSRSIDRLQLVGVSLLIAGGAGNIVDRIVYGVVRDFLNVGIGSFRTGIFNIADLAITVASVLLVIRVWMEHARSAREAASSTSART